MRPASRAVPLPHGAEECPQKRARRRRRCSLEVSLKLIPGTDHRRATRTSFLLPTGLPLEIGQLPLDKSTRREVPSYGARARLAVVVGGKFNGPNDKPLALTDQRVVRAAARNRQDRSGLHAQGVFRQQNGGNQQNAAG